MFQVEDNGTISSITEIFEKGKNFRTLFRNPETAIPERYIEALENKDGEFEVIAVSYTHLPHCTCFRPAMSCIYNDSAIF